MANLTPLMQQQTDKYVQAAHDIGYAAGEAKGYAAARKQAYAIAEKSIGCNRHEIADAIFAMEPEK